jgi:hypothetical protein
MFLMKFLFPVQLHVSLPASLSLNKLLLEGAVYVTSDDALLTALQTTLPSALVLLRTLLATSCQYFYLAPCRRE